MTSNHTAWGHIQREVDGTDTVSFDVAVRGRSAALEAFADPMRRGIAGVRELVDDPSQFRRLITPESSFALFALFPSTEDWLRIYRAWLDAAGLSPEKLQALQRVIDHPEDAEVDFLRAYHLDLYDWVRGALSSRRVAVLALDLVERPETRLGARFHHLVSPLTKAEIMLAQSTAADTDHPHWLLKTLAQQAEEEEQREKAARIAARGMSS